MASAVSGRMSYLMQRFFKQQFRKQSSPGRTAGSPSVKPTPSLKHRHLVTCEVCMDHYQLSQRLPLLQAIERRRDFSLIFSRGFVHESSRQNKSVKKGTRPRKKQQGQQKIIAISGSMTVGELQEAMGVEEDFIYEFLLATHSDLSPSTVLKPQVIEQIVTGADMHYVFLKKTREEPRQDKDAHPRPPADPSQLKPRPPVVTIMGHVDHGKTTLLDTMRKTSVAAGEAGGITQHIGAFQVSLPSGQVITFLDTPGHAAFKAMRERGASVTDIVVLVVAADDGVMEQTRESIKYARNAGVPIIVALNKCDKPDADPAFTKNDLLSNDISIEEYGGDIQCVEISALNGDNIDELCDAIMTQAELQELGADKTGLVEGVIVECKVDKGMGPIATLIVQRGTLKKGAILMAGTAKCRVRAMQNERGEEMSAAFPSQPVEVTGWKDTPAAGDLVLQVESEKRAKEVLKWRLDEMSSSKLAEDAVIVEKKSSEHRREYDARREAHSQMHWREIRAEKVKARYLQEKESASSGDPELNIIIKGDVDGSVEAILDTLNTYTAHQQCRLNVINFGVGPISDKDVELAQTFEGAVVGFNVGASKEAAELAKSKGIPLKLHDVIYRLVDDLREDLNSRLPMLDQEVVLGEATVLQPFDISMGRRKVSVAGCRVEKGELQVRSLFKLMRGQEVIHRGPLASLKHHKDDVNTVKNGTECGLRFEEQLEYQPGDTIVCYELEQIPQEVDWDLDF
ncbi:translation initiation factor IF-2, mitochondrial-like [Diadema setosum]|uniref:translation initiation factor IF-2, mitochondrial-like n=1 Tax=Diadema setosum TaxID=31175 RepID=UPI003B3BDA76